MADTTNVNTSDVLRDSVEKTIGNVVQAIEPQLNEMATKVANQAIDKTRDFATVAYERVQKQPWYLVGFAAVLLICAALVIGFSGQGRQAGARA